MRLSHKVYAKLFRIINIISKSTSLVNYFISPVFVLTTQTGLCQHLSDVHNHRLLISWHDRTVTSHCQSPSALIHMLISDTPGYRLCLCSTLCCSLIMPRVNVNLMLLHSKLFPLDRHDIHIPSSHRLKALCIQYKIWKKVHKNSVFKSWHLSWLLINHKT